MLRSLILSLLLLAAPLRAVAAEPENLTILTDARLLRVLAPLARSYANEAHTPLTVVLNSNGNLERQIEQGLEAHVLITADYGLIERLSEQGLTDVSSRKQVARTQLALVSGTDPRKEGRIAKRISFAAMVYATPNQPIIASEPTTIDGARVAALRNGQDFSAALDSRLVLEPDYEDVAEILRDSDALGLMLAVDAVAEPDITVLALLSDAISKPVVYDAVVLGGESMAAANKFVAYLNSPTARRIFAQYGFQPPTQ